MLLGPNSCRSPPSDHNPDTVPVSIVTGGEEDDVDYILNNDDPLIEFDYYKRYRTEETYNEFVPGCETLNDSMLSIASHQWKDSQLQFKIICNINEHTWETFPDMREDHSRATDNYMVRNNVTRKKSRDRDLKWSKHTIRDIRRTIRGTLKLYDFRMDERNRLYRVIRKVHGSKKKKQVVFTQKKFKYSLEEPRHVNRALEIDTKQKDTKWLDSMDLEIDSLIYMLTDLNSSQPV